MPFCAEVGLIQGTRDLKLNRHMTGVATVPRGGSVREFFGRLCTSVLVLTASCASFAAVEPLPPLQIQPKHPAISTNVAKLIEELHYSLRVFGTG